MALSNWKLIVKEEENQLRLDQLVSLYTGLSRRTARNVIKLGGVQVDKRRVKIASRLLRPGQEVRVAMDDSLGEPLDWTLPVVHEDEWLLVLNKPAGLATQGTQASDRHDLMACLHRQRPNEQWILCHRLDQGTSGVLVLAKAKHANLGQAFQQRAVKKTYLARVSGPLLPCEVNLPIGRIPNATPARFGCEGPLLDPKPSLTRFHPLPPDTFPALHSGHWVVCEPETGRTHQIRVHLAHLGTPVMGDGLYGGQGDKQLWLHAWQLAIQHPVTGEAMTLIADPARFYATEGL